MKNITLLFVSAALMLCSCTDNSTNPEDNNTPNSISLEKADSLIIDWVFSVYNPNMNPSFSLDSVVEYTTDEINTKLKGQIFSARSDVPGMQNRWFFIRHNTLYDLHGYHLDQYAVEEDVGNLIVADLDSDSNYEILYTAMWGSFYMRNTVNCFCFTGENSAFGTGEDISVSTYIDYAFHLQKESDQKVFLQYSDSEFNITIGEIILEGVENNKYLGVNLYDNIPQKILDILLIE